MESTKNPFNEEEEDDKEETLNNAFEDNKLSVSPSSGKKAQRKDSYSSKEIEMKSIIFN
jgi:hypothetical protein